MSAPELVGVTIDGRVVEVPKGTGLVEAFSETGRAEGFSGVGEELAHSSIRFGLGRFNTNEEVDYTIGRVNEAVNRLRELSPLWEMVQEGVDLSKVQWAGE